MHAGVLGGQGHRVRHRRPQHQVQDGTPAPLTPPASLHPRPETRDWRLCTPDPIPQSPDMRI
eukprot:1310203-Rhodomonas_salina.1